MSIHTYTYEDEGMKPVFDNEEWIVGIKNFKPANHINALKELEFHSRTDEQFVLLSGSCLLVTLAEDGLEFTPMKKDRVYNIPEGIPHTTIMTPGTKMVLIERSGTSMENSGMIELSEEQINLVNDYYGS